MHKISILIFSIVVLGLAASPPASGTDYDTEISPPGDPPPTPDLVDPGEQSIVDLGPNQEASTCCCLKMYYEHYWLCSSNCEWMPISECQAENRVQCSNCPNGDHCSDCPGYYDDFDDGRLLSPAESSIQTAPQVTDNPVGAGPPPVVHGSGYPPQASPPGDFPPPTTGATSPGSPLTKWIEPPGCWCCIVYCDEYGCTAVCAWYQLCPPWCGEGDQPDVGVGGGSQRLLAAFPRSIPGHTPPEFSARLDEIFLLYPPEWPLDTATTTDLAEELYHYDTADDHINHQWQLYVLARISLAGQHPEITDEARRALRDGLLAYVDAGWGQNSPVHEVSLADALLATCSPDDEEVNSLAAYLRADARDWADEIGDPQYQQFVETMLEELEASSDVTEKSNTHTDLLQEN